MKQGFAVLILILALAMGMSGGQEPEEAPPTQSSSNSSSQNHSAAKPASTTANTSDPVTETKNREETNPQEKKAEMYQGRRVYRIKEISSEFSGQTIVTKGTVYNTTETNHDLFFSIKDKELGGGLKCTISQKLLTDNPRRKELLLHSKENGDVIYFQGGITIDKGSPEMTVLRVFTNK